MRPSRRQLTLVLTLGMMPVMVQAHGFAQRYDLPVPLTLYITGAAAAVLLSFVVMAIFMRGQRLIGDYPRTNLLRTPVVRLLAHPLLLMLLRLFAVGILLLVVVAGLYGDPNPFKNIAPTMVWVIWWVGFAYVSGLAGNLWAVINPWKTIYEGVEKAMCWLRPGSRLGLGVSYPRWLGDWPAVLLFLWFVWAELVWPASDAPANLAQAVIIYSLITWFGMFLFGKHPWLRHGEAFSLLFGLLARFSPTEIRLSENGSCADCVALGNADGINCYECFERASRDRREWNLRPWAVGLLAESPISLSRMVFVILMLASVTFDGLLATPLWTEQGRWMLLSEGLRPMVIMLQGITGDAVAAVSTMALILFVLGFLLLYLAVSGGMRWMLPSSVRAEVSLAVMARLFVLSLIPIALAYHLAHYLSFLLIVGQYMIPLASDPLGLGWNLFGTNLYMVNIGIVDARFVWYTSVIAIVVGHIIAVYLAHAVALRVFQDHRTVLRSQIPMLILMVGYTILSLWMLAQPVIELG